MIANALREMVTVRGRFHRSVQLTRDWKTQGSLGEYLLTPTMRDLAIQMLRSITVPNGAKAWSITGPYGAGKSAFALFFTDVLSHRPSLHADAPSVRQEAGFELLPFLPVLVAGQRAPLVPAMLAALAQALRDVDLELAQTADASAHRPDVNDHEVVELFELAAEAVLRAGHGGLLVIIDEFGKFLEHGALHPEEVDLFVMQHLAEAATRNTIPIALITILHSSFAEYLQGVDDLQRVEWQKVQGRFVDVAFREPVDQVLRLIGLALETRFPPDLETAYRMVISSVVNAPALAEARRRLPLEDLMQDCAPLHPIAALLLLPLFRSKLAQNERSLFAFLTAQEPYGLQEFLTESVWEGGLPPLCRIDRLYDYVTAALGTTLFLGDRAHRWAEVAQALERVPASAPRLAVALVKAVGLLSLYGAPVGLKASTELLALAFDDVTGVEEALEYLKQASVLVYRRHQHAFALWEGSDVDLEDCLAEARLHVGQGNLAQRLKEIIGERLGEERESAGVRQIVARAHYIQTGTLRYFLVDVIDGTPQSLREALSAPLTPGNGQILYVLASNLRDRADLIALGRELTEGNDPERHLRILAFPKPIHGLEDTIETVEAWVWVQNNTPALEGDPVARQEVRARLLHARDWLEATAGQILGLRGYLFDASSSEWIQGGEMQPARSAKEQLGWLSDLCSDVFQQAPALHNELLNRERLSSAAAKARRNLLEAMLQHGAEPNLGLTGYPPEVSMYRSLLLDGGFHQLAGQDWSFGSPQVPWQPLWQAIDDFLVSTVGGPRPLPELIDVLRRPPFGLHEGPIPVLLCAALLTRRDDTALYEDGVYVPELRIEVFERLTRVPGAFAVQRYALSSEQQASVLALDGILHTLHLSPANGSGAPLLSVVKPLVLFAAQLPTYTKNTRQVQPPQAAAVRDALLRSRDPYTLIANELPAAIGLGSLAPQDATLYAEALKECILGLQEAYPRLLADIEAQLRAAFDLHGSSEEARSQLQARATPLVGRAGDRTLALFVREASRLDGRDWRDVLGRVVNNGQPPAQWRDADAATFQARIKPLAGEFLRLEELAAEQRVSGAAQILRIGLLDGQMQESREVVSVTPARSERIESLSEEIIRLLESLTDGSEESRRVRLAALAQVAARYLQPGEDLPRG